MSPTLPCESPPAIIPAPYSIGPAIRHEIIKDFLSQFRFGQVMGFKHLALMYYYFLDCCWGVIAVVGRVFINVANIFILIGQFL